jgi:DeoR/GlpR family transcriptional regulator of sugar metabolism
MARESHGREGAPAAFAQERHTRILDLLSERGRIRNTELADLLGVTEPTVRKDVADLARQRRLNRVHGGAIALRPVFEPDLDSRTTRNAEAKTKIAQACLALISTGDAVYIDSGTTMLRLAELLADAETGPGNAGQEGSGQGGSGQAPRNINVLTNALAVAQILADRPGIRHTVLGGSYRPAGGCFVGPLALANLGEFTVNVAFLGVTGLTEHGFTVADQAEAQVKRAVADRARRVVVAMDHTKLGTADFVKICDLDAVGTIVTDSPNDYLTELCRERGVELIDANNRASRYQAAVPVPTKNPMGQFV